MSLLYRTPAPYLGVPFGSFYTYYAIAIVIAITIRFKNGMVHPFLLLRFCSHHGKNRNRNRAKMAGVNEPFPRSMT